MKYKTILLSIFTIFLHTHFINAQKLNKQVEKKIMQTMKKQEKCWNQGDIDCFMEGYWKSEKLRFMGKKGVTYGWQNTLERYKKSYPNQEAMGQLTFDILSLEILAKDKALMVGKWHLARKEGDLEGHFSLIWQEIQKEWVIIFDHSS